MLDDVGVVVIVLVLLVVILVIVLVLVIVIVLVVVLFLVIFMVVVVVVLILVVSKFHGNQTTAAWEFPPHVFFFCKASFPKIPDRFKLRNDTKDLRQFADFPWICVFVVRRGGELRD